MLNFENILHRPWENSFGSLLMQPNDVVTTLIRRYFDVICSQCPVKAVIFGCRVPVYFTHIEELSPFFWVEARPMESDIQAPSEAAKVHAGGCQKCSGQQKVKSLHEHFHAKCSLVNPITYIILSLQGFILYFSMIFYDILLFEARKFVCSI